MALKRRLSDINTHYSHLFSFILTNNRFNISLHAQVMIVWGIMNWWAILGIFWPFLAKFWQKMAEFVKMVRNWHSNSSNNEINILWKFQPCLNIFTSWLSCFTIQIVKMLHTTPPNNKINISWKFQPTLTSFGKVIVKKPHFRANWASFGHAQEAKFAQNDQDGPYFT